MAERAIASTNFPIFLNVTKVAKMLDVVRGNETCLKFGYRTIRQFFPPHKYTLTHTDFRLSCITFSHERERKRQRKKERKKEEKRWIFFFSVIKPISKSFISSLLYSTFIQSNLSKDPAYLEYVRVRKRIIILRNFICVTQRTR